MSLWLSACLAASVTLRPFPQFNRLRKANDPDVARAARDAIRLMAGRHPDVSMMSVATHLPLPVCRLR